MDTPEPALCPAIPWHSATVAVSKLYGHVNPMPIHNNDGETQAQFTNQSKCLKLAAEQSRQAISAADQSKPHTAQKNRLQNANLCHNTSVTSMCSLQNLGK